GTGDREYSVKGENRWGRNTSITETFPGVLQELKNRYQNTDSMFFKAQVEKFMRYEVCPACNGSRLKKEALGVTIDGKSIMEICDMSIEKSFIFIDSLYSKLNPREQKIGQLIIKEIKQRLEFLKN